MKTPISKTQTRLITLLKLSCQATYEAAAIALESAGYRRSGIPYGRTWRTTETLTDAELLETAKEREAIEPVDR